MGQLNLRSLESLFQMARIGGFMFLVCCLGMALGEPWAWGGREMLPQKEQEVTQFGEVEIPALDQQNWKRPQNMFAWITMACNWRIPDDSFGRPGWFTNARILPVNPGITEFPPDQPAVYVVYEIPSLDAPMQMNANWYLLDSSGKPVGEAIGKDAQFMDMNEGYGYLEIRPPQGGWKLGEYLVKIYISSPGQQIHALSQVGTMRFSISDSRQVVEVCKERSAQ
ncbi:hypothetical protein [Petrachloros mirabilis]